MASNFDSFISDPFSQMGMAVLSQKDNNTGAALQQGLAASKKMVDEQTAKQAFGDFFKTVKAKNGQITKQDVFGAMDAAMQRGLNPEAAGNLVKFGLELTKDDGTEFSKLIKERNALPEGSADRKAYDSYIAQKGIDPFSRMLFANNLKQNNENIIDYSAGGAPTPIAPPLPSSPMPQLPTGNDPGMGGDMSWQKNLPPRADAVDTYPYSGQPKPAPAPQPVMSGLPGMPGNAPTAPAAPAPQSGPQATPAPQDLPPIGGATSQPPAAPGSDIQTAIERARFNQRQAEASGNPSNAKYWSGQLDTLLKMDERQQNLADKKTAAAEKDADMGAQKYSHAVHEAGLDELVDAMARAKTLVPDKGSIPGVNGLATWTPGFMLSDKGQQISQTIATLRNAILKARSGGAVTPQEQDRMMQELGEGAFKSDDQLRLGLKNVETILTSKLMNAQAGVSPQAIELYKKRGGTVTADRFKTPDASNVKTIGGKTYVQQNGKWFEQ